MKGGLVNPRLETLWRIAQALGSSLAELMGGEKIDEDTERIAQLLHSADESMRRKVISVVELLTR